MLVKKTGKNGAGWLFSNLCEITINKACEDIICGADKLLSSKEGFLFAWNFDGDATYQSFFINDDCSSSSNKSKEEGQEHARSFAALTKGTHVFSLNENTEGFRKSNNKLKDEHNIEIIAEKGDATTWKHNIFAGLIQEENNHDATRICVCIIMMPHNDNDDASTENEKKPYKTKTIISCNTNYNIISWCRNIN